MNLSSKSASACPDDGHVKPSRKRKRINGLLRFLLFATVMASVLTGLKVVLAAIPVTAALLQQAQAGTMTISLMLIVDGLGLSALVLFGVLASRAQKVPYGSFGLPLNSSSAQRLFQGFAGGILIASLEIGITYLLHGLRFRGFAQHPAESFRYGILWVLTFVVIALFEEALFRGYALESLSAGLGFWPAAILLSVLFGGLHLMNPGETLVGALDVVCYALLACFTLKQTGNLWFAVGLHAAWDFALTVLYSVPSSGMQAKGHLLRAELVGRPWLTGGSDGPEGSVVALIILVVFFLAFSFIFSASISRSTELSGSQKEGEA